MEHEQIYYYLIPKPLVTFKYDNFKSVISEIKKTNPFRNLGRTCNQLEEVFGTEKSSKEKLIFENPRSKNGE